MFKPENVSDVEVILCNELLDEDSIDWDSFQPVAMLLWLGKFKTFVFSLRTERWLRKFRAKFKVTKRDQVFLNHLKGIAKILNRELSFNYNITGELFDDAVFPMIINDSREREKFQHRIYVIECFIAGFLLAFQDRESIDKNHWKRIRSGRYMRSGKGIDKLWTLKDVNKLYKINEKLWDEYGWQNFLANAEIASIKKNIIIECKAQFPSIHDAYFGAVLVVDEVKKSA